MLYLLVALLAVNAVGTACLVAIFVMVVMSSTAKRSEDR